MKQPTFNWNAKDKYEELWSSKLEVSNVLKNYILGQTEKESILKNWLGREGLQLIATLTQDEQEPCNNEMVYLTCFIENWNLNIMKQ